jgi:hypothetical protein
METLGNDKRTSLYQTAECIACLSTAPHQEGAKKGKIKRFKTLLKFDFFNDKYERKKNGF